MQPAADARIGHATAWAGSPSKTADGEARAVLLIGIFAYVVVLGRIHPIPEPEYAAPLLAS